MRFGGSSVRTCMMAVVVLLTASVLYAGTDEWTDTRKAPYLLFNGNAGEMEVHWQLTSKKACTIKWSQDTTYSDSASTTEYNNSHQHKYTIKELETGKKYYFKVIAGSDTHTGSFYTAPAASATSLSFYAYGDTRNYPETQNAVAGGVLDYIDTNPASQTILIMTGDLVGDGEKEGDWDDQFFTEDAPNVNELRATIPFLSSRGNHEGNSSLFQKYFPYPYETPCYWSFDYGPAHFTYIDQYKSYSSGSTQYNWIKNDLKNSNKTWKFIILHEPGWSAGGHSNEKPVQDYIQPLCKDYGVAIVFGGHNHYYARAEVDGVQHITTGGGGAPLYSPDPNADKIVATAKKNHFCKIDIANNTLHFEAYATDASLIDSFTVYPTGIEGQGFARLMHNELHQNTPNPFNGYTTIDVSVHNAGHVSLKVYDMAGREVATLADAFMAPGEYEFVWEAGNHPDGVYYCRLSTPGVVDVRKMVLLR